MISRAAHELLSLCAKRSIPTRFADKTLRRELDDAGFAKLETVNVQTMDKDATGNLRPTRERESVYLCITADGKAFLENNPYTGEQNGSDTD